METQKRELVKIENTEYLKKLTKKHATKQQHLNKETKPNNQLENGSSLKRSTKHLGTNNNKPRKGLFSL